MSSYRTGRTRTVVVSGTASADTYNMNIYGQVQPVTDVSRLPTWQVSWCGCSIYVRHTFVPIRPFIESDAGESVTISFAFNTYPPSGVSQTFNHYSRYNAPAHYSGDLNATWAITATLEEWVEVVTAAPTGSDQLPYPVRLRFYECLQPGSVMSASVTLTTRNVTDTLSAQVPAGHFPVTADSLATTAHAQVTHLDPNASYSGSCSLTWSLPIEPSDPNFSQSRSDVGWMSAVSFRSTGCAASAYLYPGRGEDDGGGATVGTITSDARGTVYSPLRAQVLLKAFAHDQAYQGAATATVYHISGGAQQVPLVNGAGSLSVEQRLWLLYDLYGQAVLLNEWAPLSAALDAPGEGYPGRMFGHGWLFPGITISQSSALVDSCDAITTLERTWTGVNCNLFLQAGKIHAQVTGDTGTVSRICGVPVTSRLGSHGVLRLRVERISGAGVLSLWLGGKRWSFNVAQGVQDLDVLLCSPHNATASSDTTWHKWDSPGEYWGVEDVSSLQFVLSSGEWVFHQIMLPVSDVRVRIAPALARWHYVAPGGYIRPFLFGVTDGKQSLDETDSHYTTGSGFFGITRTLAYLAGQINQVDDGVPKWPGWSAVLHVTSGDGSDTLTGGLLTSQLPAFYLGGGGVIYDGSGFSSLCTWQSVPATIPAQLLFDSVQWYAGVGDVFFSGSRADTLQLPFACVLRSGVYGLVIDGDSRGLLTSGTVQLVAADSTVVGQGALDGAGVYSTTGMLAASGQYTVRSLDIDGASSALVPSVAGAWSRVVLTGSADEPPPPPPTGDGGGSQEPNPDRLIRGHGLYWYVGSLSGSFYGESIDLPLCVAGGSTCTLHTVALEDPLLAWDALSDSDVARARRFRVGYGVRVADRIQIVNEADSVGRHAGLVGMMVLGAIQSVLIRYLGSLATPDTLADLHTEMTQAIAQLPGIQLEGVQVWRMDRERVGVSIVVSFQGELLRLAFTILGGGSVGSVAVL